MEPRFIPGDRLSVYVGDRGEQSQLETGSAASVRGHIWTGASRVNGFLQFYFHGRQGVDNKLVFDNLPVPSPAARSPLVAGCAIARLRQALIFPLAAAAAMAGAPLGAQGGVANPVAPQTAGPAEVIAAERDRYERMTVPVTVNGAGPFRFLVDTGAQATVITARVTDVLGLVPTGHATLIAMASRSAVDTVEIDGLEFAGRRFGGLTAPLLRDRDIGADGIIGLDALQNLRVILDFRRDTISVTGPPASAYEAYEIVVRARRKLGQMIITDARIDGVRTAVIIDTGSWHSLANPALRRRLRARGADPQVATDVTGAELRSAVGIVRELRIGPLTLAGLALGFADSPVFAALGLERTPALLLGIGNLRPFDRVAIDFASRRVLFDVPPGAGRGRLDALFAGSGPIGR